MSVITFLIGNGFDLACGLKSRYVDSYDEYIHSDSASESIYQFKKTIDRDIDTWADFESRLAGYAHIFKDEKELVECVRDYSSYLNSYLAREQSAFFESFKGNDVIAFALRQAMAKGLAEFYYGLTQNDIRAVASSANRPQGCTFQFINYNYTNVFDELVNQVFAHGALKKYSNRTFSYTPIVHIHGKLNNDIVLGVDNDTQFVDLPYQLSRRGKRNVVKPTFIEEYDNQRMKDALAQIKTSDVICVFGLALGETDLTWRKALAEWLVEERWHHLVFYKHSLAAKNYAATAVTLKMDDEEDYKEQLLKMLFDGSLGDENRDLVYNQIHVPTGYNIFNIRETIHAARIESIQRERAKNSRPVENRN